MPTREWDAASYDRIAAPMEALGLDVLERLELAGDERVLDAGCGTGRVTEALADRLPEGRVLAVDGSAAMVEQARERLGDRADAWVADLVDLRVDPPVDAILSTATFHWIPDHDRLFSRLCEALRPGGRLVAQCGGEGNVAPVAAAARAAARVEPFAEALGGWPGPWRFASPQDTADRLRRLGWADVWTWSQRVTVTPADLREYLATVVLGSHLERLDGPLRDPFVRAVLDRLDGPDVPYVRLNVLARRPS